MSPTPFDTERQSRQHAVANRDRARERHRPRDGARFSCSTARRRPGPGWTGWVQRHLRTLAYEITVAEARERERIACGLHDDIGQLLVLARLKLGELREGTQGEVAALADDVIDLVAQAARATRSATFDLCSPVLRLGLQPALDSLADRLARAGHLAVRREGELPTLSLSEPVQAVVFRVARELCMNVQKHAQASQVCIGASVSGGALHITVEDDGRGFHPLAAAGRFSREGGFGLASAQAQMQALGGQLLLVSEPGQGTRASAVLALPA